MLHLRSSLTFTFLAHFSAFDRSDAEKTNENSDQHGRCHEPEP